MAIFRLVGNAICTGDIILYNGAFFSYATSGTGFSLTAPLVVDSAIYCQMSGNAAGNAMIFNGTIRGKGSIQAYNYTNTAGMVAIENGKYSLTLGLAFRIARVFNTPLDEVFSFIENP